MGLTLDDLIALAAVAAAVGYLARRAWQASRRRGCAGCGPAAAKPAEQRIGIDQLKRHLKR